MDHRRHHDAGRGGVGAQLVGDQSSRDTALGIQQRPKESDGCSPIPVRLHEDVQDVTVLVDRAPQILSATLDRDEHLVERPGVSHPTAAAPQPPRVDRTEPLAPLPNRLVGDRHASLREETFDIAEAEAEPMVEPDRVADDVGRESISVIAGRLAPHRLTLPLVASTRQYPEKLQKTPYLLAYTVVRAGPNGSENGWQNPKRLAVSTRRPWPPRMAGMLGTFANSGGSPSGRFRSRTRSGG